jgi:hypothetical protein
MNSDKQPLNKSATVANNMDLVFNCIFKGYISIILFDGGYFCKISLGKKTLGAPEPYYDLDEFQFKYSGKNTIRGLIDHDPELDSPPKKTQYTFKEIESRCKLYYMFEPEDDKNKALALLKTPIVVNIHEVKKTGEIIYLMNGVAYSEHFPLEWALAPKREETMRNGSSQVFIYGPGTSKMHCANCNAYGSLKGAFIGYCSNCAKTYNFTRGYEYLNHGVEMEMEMEKSSYLKNVDLQKIGYLNLVAEKAGMDDICLPGGDPPSGVDICDDQLNVDPFDESKCDKSLYVTNDDGMKVASMRISRRYPRRAYGIPAGIKTRLFQFQYSKYDNNTPEFLRNKLEATPEFFRNKLEEFFSAKGIEVTDNNYSFPIGPREEWDHYRLEKRPSYWYAWNVVKRGNIPEEDLKLELRLYMSNPIIYGEGFNPSTIVLGCNYKTASINESYWTLCSEINDWIFDRSVQTKQNQETQTQTQEQMEPEEESQVAGSPFVQDQDQENPYEDVYDKFGLPKENSITWLYATFWLIFIYCLIIRFVLSI